jgi:hypothetical protein
MLTIKDRHISVIRSAGKAGGALALLFFLGFSASVLGQNVVGLQDSSKPVSDKAVSSTPKPIASVYKDVKIGTSADEVRELLGKAEIDDKDGFYYEMDTEMVQIRLDEDKKVRLISVTYTSKAANAPKYSDIFGAEPTNAKPDGSFHKLIRYPAAGYWVAYSKTAGAEPTITVTMQKL